MNAELQFSPMNRIVQIVLALLLLFPFLGAAAEPRIFIMGVWPNRLRLFDEQKQEFIEYQMNELKSAELVENEEDALEAEKRLLITSEQRLEKVEQVRALLEGDSSSADSGVLEQLRAAASNLSSLTAVSQSSARPRNCRRTFSTAWI